MLHTRDNTPHTSTGMPTTHNGQPAVHIIHTGKLFQAEVVKRTAELFYPYVRGQVVCCREQTAIYQDPEGNELYRERHWRVFTKQGRADRMLTDAQAWAALKTLRDSNNQPVYYSSAEYSRIIERHEWEINR